MHDLYFYHEKHFVMYVFIFINVYNSIVHAYNNYNFLMFSTLFVKEISIRWW